MHVAEFFAGIGLVRMGLEVAPVDPPFRVVWANDIEPAKRDMYAGQFGAAHFHLGDVTGVRAADLPPVDLATASFPCTDLSLAGNMLGLAGEESGLFFQFVRVLGELAEGGALPAVALVENVPSFATSHGGADLVAAIQRLNGLGYSCDLLQIDARHFVPQSRPRLFIVGSQRPVGDVNPERAPISAVRPRRVAQFFARHHGALTLHALPLPDPGQTPEALADVVEPLPPADPRWWDEARKRHFLAQLSPIQQARLNRLAQAAVGAARPVWATAYRRTRNGAPAWEIRPDAISGCLRTARGGSSKQALVGADAAGEIRARWLTAREYARLQGAPDYRLDGVPENRARFGFGDAVCVPVITWLASHYLHPLLSGQFADRVVEEALAGVG